MGIRFIYCFVIFVFANIGIIKSQFIWAKNFGSNQPERGAGITVDASGNVYSVGTFSNTVDFDPGAGIFNLSTTGSNDIYILKLDGSGNFLWAKNLGGTGNDAPIAITVDATGNLYVTGFFSATADFDPNAGILNLTSTGGTDIFVSKLDALGNVIWAKSMGGVGATDQGRGIEVDASNNVYVTGFFLSTSDFDPGAGIFNLASSGGNDIFILKLDATGGFLWANNVGGINADQGNSIAVDASNNVIVGGFFRGTNIDFDPGVGSTLKTSVSGSDDVFVLKLNSSGTFLWASTMGGTSNEKGNDVFIDGANNIYTTGSFFLTADFDPGAGTFNLTSAGGSDVFIVKLNLSGNFVWAKGMGGPQPDVGLSIAIDGSGNSYTTGNFQTFSAQVADFDPNAGVFNLVSSALTVDVFIVSLDVSGNFRCAGQVGGTGTDNGASIYVDAFGTSYLTGEFVATVDFDPFAGTFNLTASNVDPFILKLNLCTVVLPIHLANFNSECIENSIQIRWETATEIKNDFFTIERSEDAEHFSVVGTVKGAGNSNAIKNYTFNDPHFSPNKPNYYRLKQTDFNGQFEYSKVIVANCNSKKSISIYPNPSNGKFIISSSNLSNYDVMVYDVQGKIINSICSNGELLSQIDLTDYKKGIYFLTIKSDDFISTHKIIVSE